MMKKILMKSNCIVRYLVCLIVAFSYYNCHRKSSSNNENNENNVKIQGGEIQINDEKMKIVKGTTPIEPMQPPPRPGLKLKTKGTPPQPHPTSPDPEAGDFTIEEALEGLPSEGRLIAEIKTTFGGIYCELYPDKAPRTVANFVGLARGKRAWWNGKTGQWEKSRFYDGLIIHRVVPGFVIQGGDPWGTGEGSPGYFIPLESNPGLSHDEPGVLAMAHEKNDPNTNGSQFYITDGPAPHLNGNYSIFGKCTPAKLINIIARVPQTGKEGGNMPLTDVIIESIKIKRESKNQGAVNAN